MQNQRRTLVCKRCGEIIDIKRRREDGSLQCPKCKMIYRPRPAQPQQQSPMRRPQKRKKPIKFIIGFVVLLLLLITLVGSCGNKDNNVVTAPVETQQPTQEPTATPTPNSPYLKFGELLSITETPTYLFDENDQFIGTEDNIVVVKAKISPSYNNEATIKQNYLNIEDLIKNQGFDKYNELQYWAVADMTDGSEGKVFSCTVDEVHIHMIKNSSVATVDGYDVYLKDDLWILPSLLE